MRQQPETGVHFLKYEDDILLTKCRLHTLLTAISSLVLVEISSGQDM